MGKGWIFEILAFEIPPFGVAAPSGRGYIIHIDIFLMRVHGFLWEVFLYLVGGKMR
jgi:hypothetical protein